MKKGSKELKKKIKDNAEKKGVSLMVRMLTLVLLPIVVLSAALGTVALLSIQDGIEKAVQNGLKTTCISIESSLQNMSTGTLAVNQNNELCKGTFNISSSKMLRDIKKQSGVDITIFKQDTRVATSIDSDGANKMLGTKVDSAIYEKVVKNNEEYFATNVEINGELYYGYYMPFKSNSATFGMVFAGKPQSEAKALIQEKILLIAGIGLVFFLIFFVGSVMMARRIVKAAVGAKNVIEGVSKGDLTTEISDKDMQRGDEIGAMVRMVRELLISLRTIIGDVKNSVEFLAKQGTELEQMAKETNATSDEISKAVDGISEGAVAQAEDTNTATESIVQIGNMIEQIAQKVEKLDASSDQMKKADDESDVMINELSESNDKVIGAIATIGEHVMSTNDSVQSINEAVEMISSIAEQTNLLSLNASIEAARAGEHGKGFAVVASEIQKLAEQSNESAHTIQGIIHALLEASESTVSIMDSTKGVVAEQQDKLTATKTCLVDVTTGINTSKEEIVGIREEIEVLNSERAGIVDVIQNLSAISEENAASTEETTASMEELNATVLSVSEASNELQKLAMDLEETMKFFKL